MAKPSAEFWINHLQLNKHIEGGWYREVYRSALAISKEKLPPFFKGERNFCTHIYFLLEKEGFSAFHRIKSDELWHFYAGDPLVVYEIEEGETDRERVREHLLGGDIEKNQSPFCVIKGGNWFASRVAPGSEYSLVGCTVSPGFDFTDFELARREELVKKFPQHAALINSLTKQT